MQEQTLHLDRNLFPPRLGCPGSPDRRLENLDAPSGKSEPVHMSVDIDRSGSMSGDKRMQAATASARMVRSLTDQDRVAAIAFDVCVEILAGPKVPDEVLARRLERLDSRGSTNLYGGWLAGAKRAGRGGRVLRARMAWRMSTAYSEAGRMLDRLKVLARHYEEASASVHRKMSHQRHFKRPQPNPCVLVVRGRKDLVWVEKFRMVRGHEDRFPSNRRCCAESLPCSGRYGWRPRWPASATCRLSAAPTRATGSCSTKSARRPRSARS